MEADSRTAENSGSLGSTRLDAVLLDLDLVSVTNYGGCAAMTFLGFCGLANCHLNEKIITVWDCLNLF